MQLIVRNGELQNRNGELQGVVRRVELEKSQLKQEVNRLAQLIREKDAELEVLVASSANLSIAQAETAAAQAETEKARARADAAEAAATHASASGREIEQTLAAQGVELCNARAEVSAAQARAEAAEITATEVQADAAVARADAARSRASAAAAEACATRSSTEEAAAKAAATKAQDENAEILGRIDFVAGQIRGPPSTAIRGKKRGRGAGSRAAGRGGERSEEPAPTSHDSNGAGDGDRRRLMVLQGLCDLVSFGTGQDLGVDALETVLTARRTLRKEKCVQVDATTSPLVTVEATQADMPQPKETEEKEEGQENEGGSEVAVSMGSSISSCSPLADSAQNGRRISSRREMLNAKTAAKEAAAQRVEEERAQRARDAKRAREARRASQGIMRPWSERELQQEQQQQEAKKKQKTQQARRTKLGEQQTPRQQLEQPQQLTKQQTNDGRKHATPASATANAGTTVCPVHEKMAKSDEKVQERTDVQAVMVETQPSVSDNNSLVATPSVETSLAGNATEVAPSTHDNDHYDEIGVEEVPMPMGEFSELFCGGVAAGGQLVMGAASEDERCGEANVSLNLNAAARDGGHVLSVGAHVGLMEEAARTKRQNRKKKDEKSSRSSRRRSIRY